MTYLTEEDRMAAAKCRPPHPVADIVAEVAEATGVRREDILGDSRKQPLARARQMVMFIAHREGVPLSQIGRALRRDHTTVLHGIRAEEARRQA